ncbi:MAG: hypothetical protein PHR87_03660 [Sulfurospirillaceae bacterium]|nr:hypothetical protein [Sulfurospirillaceae bacterium]
MISQIMKLCSFSRNSYYVWKREGRPIIQFLEKYFSDDELEEFLQKGSIAKLDSFNNNKTITNIEVLNEVSNLVRKQLERKITSLDSIGTKTVSNIIKDYFKQSNENIDIKDFNLYYKNISDIQNYYAQDIADIEIKWLKKGIQLSSKNKEAFEVEISKKKEYRIDIITNFFNSLNESELFLLLREYKNLLKDNEYLGISFYL